MQGTPIRKSNFTRRYWKPAATSAGFAEVVFHELRHTAATIAIQPALTPKALQLRMGHSSITVTLDRYGHLMPGADEALADSIDELVSTQGHLSDDVIPPPQPATGEKTLLVAMKHVAKVLTALTTTGCRRPKQQPLRSSSWLRPSGSCVDACPIPRLPRACPRIRIELYPPSRNQTDSGRSYRILGSALLRPMLNYVCGEVFWPLSSSVWLPARIQNTGSFYHRQATGRTLGLATGERLYDMWFRRLFSKRIRSCEELPHRCTR